MTSAYSLYTPTGPAIPLIIDSPHSSNDFPATVPICAPKVALDSGWDAWVDELWQGAISEGAHLLAARFHRSYIDANRSMLDIDAELLAQPWPGPIATSEKTRAGMGLIRRYALPGIPVYDKRLSVAEVQSRLDHYYLPYHRRLKTLLDEAHARFGAVWHIDCHSMKSVGNAMNTDAGALRPDVVIGDVDHTTALPEFSLWLADQFKDLGYHVSINRPYKGAELVKAYSDPAARRYSLQIELNRRLYMNEQGFSKHEGFMLVQKHLHEVAKRTADYIRAKLKNSPDLAP